MNRWQIAPGDGQQMGGHRLVVARDQDHAIVRMTERVDLDHRRHDVARYERVAHPAVGLSDPVANVADREDAGFTAGLEDAVADLFDQRAEVERARVAHPVRAVDQDLWLGEILLGPVHAQAQRVALKVHLAEALAAQLTWVGGHGLRLIRRSAPS